MSINTHNITNVSNLILSSLKEEEVRFYTGETEKSKILECLDSLILEKQNFFSFENVLTYKVDLKNVGIVISYPSNKSKIFKKNFISFMNKKNINIEDMEDECFDGEYFIDILRVDQNFRGLGISKILLNLVEEKAKKLNFKLLSLIFCKDNEVAKTLYSNYGFVVDTELDILGVGFFHMVKKI